MRRPKSVRDKFFGLFCVISSMLLGAFGLLVTLVYFINPNFYTNIFNIVFLTGAYSIGAGFCFAWAYSTYSEQIWNNVVDDIRKAIKAVEDGDYDYKMEVNIEEGMTPLVLAFNAMTRTLCKNKFDLGEQTEKINTQNQEIVKANKDLFESYKKLTDTYNLLNESEQKYYTLVNNLPDLLCVIKFDGTVYFANDSVKNMLGYTKNEVEGRKIYELDNKNATITILKKIGHRLDKRGEMKLNLNLAKKNGNKIKTEITLTKFSVDGQCTGVQAIVRDVTKAKELEKQLIKRNNELSIVNNISKELNVSLQLEKIVEVVVQQIASVLKNPICYFSLLNAKTGEFIPNAYAGDYINSELLAKYGLAKYNINETYIARMFEKSDPVLLSDFTNDNLIKEINTEQEVKIREVVLMPVKIKNKGIGILTICSLARITENQINLLSSISNNTAIAIENAMLYQSAQRYFVKTVDALVATIEAKDKYTEGHSFRVSNMAMKIADKLKLPANEVEQVRIAGILHDVGKIGIPDNILNKPSKLNEKEYQEIQKHPLISSKILESVDFPQETRDAIIMHHERLDGSGYPYGRKGDNIPKVAQIIAVADALDAMTSKRAYREPMELQKAIKELDKCKGKQFSPTVVDALHKVVNVYDDVEI